MKAAEKKLARLEKRVDFTQVKLATHDIFSGVRVVPSPESHFVCHLSDRDAAQAAAWAIKRETGIQCAFRNECDLYALATVGTVHQLEPIARRITDGISVLWQQYHKAGGLAGDRTCFLSGCYDGMTGEQRPLGTPLPLRAIPPVRRVRAKRGSVATPQGLAAHPYSLALSLGRSIRLDVAITEIAGELERKIKGELEDVCT